MGGVMLGMPGPWADSSYEPADHYSTKIGGLPDWPFSNVRHDMLECNACGSNLCLIAQVYAPISSKSLAIEDRVIYIFGCLISHCETPLWRALRVQKISIIEESMPSPSISVSKNYSKDDLWSFDNDNDDDLDLEELGKAFSEAVNLSSNGKQQKKDAESSRKPLPAGQPASSIDNKIPVMPCFYIYSQEEKLLRKATSESPKKLPSLYEDDSEDHLSEERYEEESYEYDRALNVDRTYLKFKKRMDEYPEQCFRYSYGGKPLLSSGGSENPGKCTICGESRHYEMQLMPPIIYFLQQAADERQTKSLEKFNWMTLVVYTCSKSCSRPSFEGKSGSEEWLVAEEAVIIQYE